MAKPNIQIAEIIAGMTYAQMVEFVTDFMEVFHTLDGIESAALAEDLLKWCELIKNTSPEE